MSFAPLPNDEHEEPRQTINSFILSPKWVIFLFLCLAAGVYLWWKPTDLQMMASYRQATVELDKQRYSLRQSAKLGTPAPIGSGLMGRLPQIVWVVVEGQPKGMPILEQVVVNNLRIWGQASSFKVVVVTVEEAYQYLSVEMTALLTETLQTRRIDINVCQVVSLALLLEHGGVTIRLNQTILTEPLHWLAPLFANESQSLTAQPEICLPDGSQVALFWDSQQDRYYDVMVAATARSRFLWDCWQMIESVLWFGRWPYQTEQSHLSFSSPEEYIDRTYVYRIDGVVQSVLDFRIKALKALKYYDEYHSKQDSYDAHLQPKCQSPVALVDLSKINTFSSCSFASHRFAQWSKQHLIDRCGPPKYLIHSLINQCNEHLLTAVTSQSIAHIHPASMLAQLLTAPLNAALWTPLPTTRHPQFCIVGPDPVDLADTAALTSLRSNIQSLGRQTYLNWTAFYFIKSSLNSSQADQLWRGQQGKELTAKVELIESADQFEVAVRSANLQIAVANHCPKHSIVLILEAFETFTEQTALDKLAAELTNVGVFAAMLSLKLKDQLIQPVTLSQQHCQQYHIKHSEKELILNHLRVFDSDLYKLIPAFELKTIQGQHHSLLPAQLTMLHYACPYKLPAQYAHLHHSFRTIMAFPETLAVLPHIVIVTDSYMQPSLKEQKLLEHKAIAHSLNQSFIILGKSNFPVSKILVFNEDRKDLANKLQSPKQKGEAEMIPRIIHQVWMGGEIPAVRKQLQQRNLKLHPNYTYYLWTSQNITPTAFPLTHRIIHNLLRFDPVSPYSKMAMVADLVRFEALYIYGGFYYDINIELFTSLDAFRSYWFVTGTEIAPTHRAQLSLALFGLPPRHPWLLRLLSAPALNSLQLFNRFTNFVTGPYFFSRLLQNAEMREDVLLLPFETVYSFRKWYNEDLCEVKRPLQWWESEKSNLGKREEEVHWLRENCSSYYPHAVAIDHFSFGASWLTRKNTVATWNND